MTGSGGETSFMRRATSLAVAFVLVVLSSSFAVAQVDKSANVRLLQTYRFNDKPFKIYKGATDIAFHGRYAYVAGGAGLHIYDVTSRAPREISFISCPGSQNDVAVVTPGLVALGYHESQCGALGGGITLIDVSDAARPRIRGSVEIGPSGAHTITTYPGKSLIYSSPGGNNPGNNRFETIVDTSDPDDPMIVGGQDVSLAGCHDLSFSFTRGRKLGFCAAGYTPATEIWDVSDPLAPEVIGRVASPLNSFHHSAVATPDGKFLGLSDENFACAPTQGAIWFYDITDPGNPVLKSHFDMPLERTDATNRYCTAHNFNFVPGTYKMVLSWYNSGMNVIDFSDPAAPKEIAHYTAPEVDYWSTYFYAGRVFASDTGRGLDVLEVKGL